MISKQYDISYDEAYNIALNNVQFTPTVDLAISESVGHVIAHDIAAVVDSPSTNASAKDGFAVVSADIENAGNSPVILKVIGTVAAGGACSVDVVSGSAVRVLSGARIPNGADAVLAEEFAKLGDGTIEVFADAKKGKNILFQGSDVKLGELIGLKGQSLTPSMIGFLVAGGISKVTVYKKPKIGLLATGDEILMPGTTPENGKLYASNIAIQNALFKSRGFETVIRISPDSFESLQKNVENLLDETDIVITSGGAWKGDRDLIIKVLNKLGWELKFHQVRMGPGKAVGMGIMNNKPIFCLPGGPPSNEMAFLMIALPAIYKMTGYNGLPFFYINGILESSVESEADWTQFYHGLIIKKDNSYIIRPLRLQSRLASMKNADVIFKIPEGIGKIKAGDNIGCICLDHNALLGAY